MVKKIFLFLLLLGLIIMPSFVFSQVEIQDSQGDGDWVEEEYFDYPLYVHEPIILVPGILASWNWQAFFNRGLDQWDFTPAEGEKTYLPLISYFQDQGFVLNEDLFIAFYDWRQPNPESMQEYFLPILEKAKSKSATGKVKVIAHSMGGIVTRHYIQSDQYQNDISTFVDLATPHRGASDSFLLWSGGFAPKQSKIIEKGVINFFIWLQGREDPTQVALPRWKTVQEKIKSVAELLPVYDFVVDGKTGEIVPTENLFAQNPVLNSLNVYPDPYLSALPGGIDLKVDDVLVYAGTNVPTLDKVILDRSYVSGSGKWKDGKPVKNQLVLDSSLGDNTVLQTSALMPLKIPDLGDNPPVLLRLINHISQFLLPIAFANSFVEVYAKEVSFLNQETNQQFVQKLIPGATHRSIVTDAIHIIGEDLGLPKINKDYRPKEDQELSSNSLGIFIASPVLPTIKTPSGEIIDLDSKIENVTVFESGDPLGPKAIFIENPENGTYGVELEAVGDGPYSLGVYSSLFEDSLAVLDIETDDAIDPIIPTVTGQVSTGDVIDYQIQFNSENVDLPPVIKEVALEKELCASLKECLLNLINSVIGYLESGDINPKLKREIKDEAKIIKIVHFNFLKEKDLPVFLESARFKKFYVKNKLLVRILDRFEKTIDRGYQKNRITETAYQDLKTQLDRILTFIPK